MADLQSVVRSISALTVLGDTISKEITDFTTIARDLPLGFSGLGDDLSANLSIIVQLEGSLNRPFDSTESLPQDAITELSAVLTKCLEVFSHLQTLVHKFVDHERGGPLAKISRTWRLYFADKDIDKIRSSLQAQRSTLNMALLLANNQATGQADHDATVEQLALKLQQQAKLMEAEVAPPVQTPSPTPAIGPGSLGGDISKASPAHATNEAPILDTPAPGMPTPLPNTTSPQFVRRYPKGGPQSITTSLGSVLMSAVDGGKEKIVEQLLDKGADPNTEGALERAAVLNDPKSMQHLLDFGADPNVKNTESRTVLFTACEYDHGDAVMLLLERGADPNLPSPDPPIWAAIPHPDVLKLLLDAGADSKVPGLLENAAWRDSVPSIQTLLDAGVDINGKNPDGKTALYVACEHDHEDVVELLLRKGADPNFPGPDPPIRAAIQYSNILELLLEAGADFKASGLLENAAWHNSTQSIKTLLDSGVDINDKNPDGKTALYVACEYDHEDVVGLLLERGADPNLPGPDPPISVATRHPNILKLILDAGANPNTPGSLELAAWHDSAPSAQHLIAAGADVNAEHDGKTALRTACTWGHLEVVNVLLENGADVNAKDESGATALDLAAGAGHDDVVSSLLSHL